ncbi:MAG: Autotransporter adhesin [Labilithrix sp.]|nr:Autotransporter adhesin [Labilithrix sp.]
MRALLLFSGIVVAAIGAACTLTSDLDGLSGDEADAAGSIDAPIVTADGEMPPTDGSSSAMPDASDPSTLYAAIVRADEPVAYYRFEEPSDANAAKDEIAGRSATSTGAGVKFGGAGVRGRGVTFDGDSLDVGDFFDFSGLQPFTLELWVRGDADVGSGILIHKRLEDQGAFESYVFYIGGNRTPHFEVWGVDLSAWSETPLPASFAHVVVAVAYDNGKGNAKMYINAQPASAGGFDNTAAVADTVAHLRFGLAFKGTLDEVAIYDKALPADRIVEHYRAGR